LREFATLLFNKNDSKGNWNWDFYWDCIDFILWFVTSRNIDDDDDDNNDDDIDKIMRSFCIYDGESQRYDAGASLAKHQS